MGQTKSSISLVLCSLSNYFTVFAACMGMELCFLYYDNYLHLLWIKAMNLYGARILQLNEKSCFH